MESLVDGINLFGGIYKDKRVLITGHTGFKGSWLCVWLLSLEAKVCGFSLYYPSIPCHFEVTNLKERIVHYEGDICNLNELKKVIEEFQPQIIFHLAAQSIVRRSYDNPKLTFDTNLGGTVNLLECVRIYPFIEGVVIITSDKCYRNLEWEWGYREDDLLGGDDPYSASKACAEIACKAYVRSYFREYKSPKIATARAGNVIGGGDWAEDRIIPDCVRAWRRNKPVILRKPEATRPWQHVLEPLSGYLWLGANLIVKPDKIAGEAFNFGPDNRVIKSVRELVDLFAKYWDKEGRKYIVRKDRNKESTLLKLNCDKALRRLKWHSLLTFEETVKMAAEWYKYYYKYSDTPENIYKFSIRQIRKYIKIAYNQDMPWVKGEF